MRNILVFFLVALLAGCVSRSVPHYSIVPDNISVLKSIGVDGVKIGSISDASNFDDNCRGSSITPPVNMSFSGYIASALGNELKMAGLYNEKQPKNVLSGLIDQMEFSSTNSLTKGEWKITLTLQSSNGKKVSVTENYQFDSGFEGSSACRRTAEAFLPAVQNLISKLFNMSEFRALIQ